MIFSLTSRILRTVDPVCLAKVGWNFGFKGARSVLLFKKRMEKGVFFPPFYVSILNSCNLHCQGCWVDVDKPREAIKLDELNKIVNDAKKHGNAFFGILGGEPFMHPELLDFLQSWRCSSLHQWPVHHRKSCHRTSQARQCDAPDECRRQQHRQ